jgi:hypothetical protein
MLKFLTISTITLSTLNAFECKAFDRSSLEVGGLIGSYDGYLQIGDKSSTKLDLKDDLDLTKSKNSIQAAITSGSKKHKFAFKATKFKYSGKKRLSKDILINSENYAKATILKSRLDIRWAKIKYRYLADESLSFGVDLNALRLKSTINNKNYRKNLIIPAIAIDYNIDLAADLAFITKTSLTPIGKSRYSDAYAGLAYKLPYKNCSSLHLGYQVNSFKVDTSKLKSELNYHGLYAGIKVEF